MTLHLTGTWLNINSHTYGLQDTPAQITQLYLPSLHGLIHPPTIIVGACTTSLSYVQVLPFSSLWYHTPPDTPLLPKTPHTPLHPHFSGAIFW